MRQAMGDSAIPPQLKEGERWNAEQGRVESVPGSSEYIAQSGKHSKDYDARQTVELKMGDAIDRVNDILDPKKRDALERNFGGWNAMVTQFFPGAGLEGKNKIDQLKSVLKGAGLEMMRSGGSIGQMTEREWPIVERMIANINPTLSEEDAKTELGKVAAYMKNIKEKSADVYQTEWRNTQFFKQGGAKPPGGAGNSVTLPDGRQLQFPSGAAAEAFRRKAGL